MAPLELDYRYVMHNNRKTSHSPADRMMSSQLKKKARIISLVGPKARTLTQRMTSLTQFKLGRNSRHTLTLILPRIHYPNVVVWA